MKRFSLFLLFICIFLSSCSKYSTTLDNEPVIKNCEYNIDKSSIEYTGMEKSLKLGKYVVSIPQMKDWSYIKSIEGHYIQASYEKHTEEDIGDLARYNIYYKPCDISVDDIINSEFFEGQFLYNENNVYVCFEEQVHDVLCWNIYQEMKNKDLIWIQVYDDTAIEYVEGYIDDNRNLSTDEVLSLTLLDNI